METDPTISNIGITMGSSRVWVVGAGIIRRTDKQRIKESRNREGNKHPGAAVTWVSGASKQEQAWNFRGSFLPKATRIFGPLGYVRAIPPPGQPSEPPGFNWPGA